MAELAPPPEETAGQHCARWLKSAKAKATETKTVLTWDEVAKIIDATLTGLNYFKHPASQPKARKKPVSQPSEAQKSQFGDRKAIPPTPEQVTAYSASIGVRLEGQEFCDHYDSNGWKVGKTSMKDWQAAVRTWGRDPRRKIKSTAGKDYSKLG